MSTSGDSYVMFTPDTRSEISDLASEADYKLSLMNDAGNLSSDLSVDLLPLDGDGTLLVSTQHPRVPDGELEHVPCDIVLVIDVSGSMATPAPLPDTSSNEVSGLTILDLTKHAARTILENLKERDRLGIVAFDNDAKVVQDLQYMTEDAKNKARANLKSLRPGSSTNLWGGIRAGLHLFNGTKGTLDSQTKKQLNCNVQSLFILTDGMPNYMCPPQGYVPKLKPLLNSMAKKQGCVPSIHTFGFGYQIRSGLMQSIAETGGGNYAFIPDVGMIGTVFVHATANLFSTYAVAARLNLEVAAASKTQNVARFRYNAGIPSASNEWGDQLTIDLGNLQFGQSRDVVVKMDGHTKGAVVNATLSFLLPNGDFRCAKSTVTLTGKPSQKIPAHAQYHIYRNRLTSVLATLYPPRASDGEHVPVNVDGLTEPKRQLVQLSKEIRADPACSSSEDIKSLYEDINGDQPAGQVLLAMTGEATGNERVPYWTKWGQHYLSSLLHAHMRQVCNTFKDPGPLRYGVDSPLFIHCRDKLDEVFETLPPPEITPGQGRGGRAGATMNSQPVSFVGSMSRYHRSDNPCFEGSSPVRCADGSQVPIKNLRLGTDVWTPAGTRKIHAIVRTTAKSGGPLCRVGDLWVTPWHPIMRNNAWVFPAEVAEEVEIRDTSVYSVVLESSSDPNAHAICVGGQTAVTLGHGMVGASTTCNDDARIHSFFGNYESVMESLSRLTIDAKGRFECGGMERFTGTGLVCGFTKVQLPAFSACRDVKASSPIIV